MGDQLKGSLDLPVEAPSTFERNCGRGERGTLNIAGKQDHLLAKSLEKLTCSDRAFSILQLPASELLDISFELSLKANKSEPRSPFKRKSASSETHCMGTTFFKERVCGIAPREPSPGEFLGTSVPDIT